MIFRRARRRLAAAVGAIAVALVGTLSIGVYLFVVASFDFDAASGEAATTAEMSFGALRTGLIGAVVATAVVAPALGWFLAGLSLSPAVTAYEAQQRFVDDASHELRTPLTALVGEIDLALTRPRSAADYRAVLIRAGRHASRIRTTLAGLLFLSRQERGSIRVITTPLRTLVEDVVASLDDADRSRIDLDDTVAAPVVIAADLTVGAVRNAIDNAVKHTNGPVRVSARLTGGHLIISVVDDGPGLSERDAARAFQPFWRGDATTDGEGLGLSLLQRSIEAQGGEVRFLSSPERGTTVTMRIPLSRSRHERLRSVETDAETPRKRSE